MSTATVWSDDHFIAGDVALDFANTVYRRTPEVGADLLDSTEALMSWLRRAELLPGDEARDGFGEADGFGDDRDVLGEARAIRELFWVIFEAQKDGRALPSDALAGLLDTARGGVGGEDRREVSLGPDGSARALTAPGALTVLALHGVRLSLAPLPRPVRACDRCGWFFVDSSRGRRRRWCNMKICGNQAKAARHRSARP